MTWSPPLARIDTVSGQLAGGVHGPVEPGEGRGDMWCAALLGNAGMREMARDEGVRDVLSEGF